MCASRHSRIEDRPLRFHAGAGERVIEAAVGRSVVAERVPRDTERLSCMDAPDAVPGMQRNGSDWFP